jgi:hypothetical protein
MGDGKDSTSAVGASEADHRQRWWRRLSGRSFERERLAQAIAEFETKTSADARAEQEPWAEIVAQYLDQAKAHFGRDEFDPAWSALKAAQRAAIPGLSEPALALEAQRVTRETSEKLSGWRKDAVQGIFETSLPETDLVTRVSHAREILDEHQDNVYRRLRLLARHLAGAALLLVAALTLLMVAATLGWAAILGGEDSVMADWRKLATVLVLGAAGAVLSGVVGMTTTELDRRIPQLRAQPLLLALRPLVGAGSAVLVVVILQSGLGGTVQLSETAVLAVAAIAGFSERIATHAIENSSKAITR